MPKVWGRFFEILCASQKVRTLPKQNRIIIRRILISDYKCWQIWSGLIWDVLCCSKLVIPILACWPYPVHRVQCRIKNVKEEMCFHLSDVPLPGGSRLSWLLILLNNIYKVILLCTNCTCALWARSRGVFHKRCRQFGWGRGQISLKSTDGRK